jgi:thiol-disulfide isomerase/thioredoxin
MSRHHILAGVVALALATGMYAFWSHFKTRFENQEIDQRNELLHLMETQGVPAFSLPNAEGETISSEVMKGKVAIINFWASWCDPCVREFPSMLQLVEHFKGELILIAISNDENKEDMLNFAKAFAAQQDHVYILWDPKQEVSAKYGTFKLPETYLVGPDLKLIRKIVGVERWYTDGSTRYLADVIESFKETK